jgi:KilA-N domain
MVTFLIKKIDKLLNFKSPPKMIEQTKFQMLYDKLQERNIHSVNLDLYILDKNNNLIKNVDEETGHINVSLLCEFYDQTFDNWINEQRTQKFIESLIKKKKDVKFRYITNENTKDLKEYLFYRKTIDDNDYMFATEVIAIDILRWCSEEYIDLCERLIEEYKV